MISDTGAGTPVPMLMAVGAVHHRLVGRGLRTLATLVAETDEAREAHHLACLLGYGAEAVCPRLALETVAALAAGGQGGRRPALAGRGAAALPLGGRGGVLKIMSKMGIADVAAYCGAQIFDIVGLAPEVVELCFPGTHSPVGGVGFAEFEREALDRAGTTRLESPGYVKYRKGGEPHETDADVVEAAHALRLAVRNERRDRYERFAELVDARRAMELRDLLELVPAAEPVPLDEVEPAEAIVQRFSAGGMSHGALSAEAHQTIAIAFNNLRARSNCGEGGEDPARFRTERNSRIKQVASGRFGVTPEYAAFADELQIKIAQGSKPGRRRPAPRAQGLGGDRAASAHDAGRGADLAAAAPRHLLDRGSRAADLRPPPGQSGRRRSRSSSWPRAVVGLVAAGVVKALADVVHIAGSDGGTGASPLSSIKNAGLPWELGLAETQSHWSRTAYAGASGCEPTAG